MKSAKAKPAKAEKGVVQKPTWYQALDKKGGKSRIKSSKFGGKKSANKSA
ncbi:MAG: hypothetical protein ABGW81_04780 [Paracoccaceae bacterium]